MMQKYINMSLVRQIKISYRSLSKLHDWSSTWLLSLNAQKCKVVSYGRHADKNYKYKMIQQDRIIELDREDQIKDLGVILKIWTLACILLKELIKPIACYG